MGFLFGCLFVFYYHCLVLLVVGRLFGELYFAHQLSKSKSGLSHEPFNSRSVYLAPEVNVVC